MSKNNSKFHTTSKLLLRNKNRLKLYVSNLQILPCLICLGCWKADGHWINRCKDCLHCGIIIGPLIITKCQPVLFLRKYDKGHTEKLASSQFHYRLQKNLLWIEAEKQFTRSPVETGCSSSSKVYLLYIWLSPLRGLEITHSQKPHYPKIDQQVQCRQGRCLYWFWSSLSWLNSSTSERVKDNRRDIWTRNLVYI